MVGSLALGVCNLQGDDLAHPVLPYRRDDEHLLTHHPPIYAHLLVASARKRPVFGDCEEEDGDPLPRETEHEIAAPTSGRTSSCTGSPRSRPHNSADSSTRKGAHVTLLG